MYPMPTTRDMLRPGARASMFPAALKICGTAPDRPSPNNAHPASVTGSHGEAMTVPIPAPASSVPYRTTATAPTRALTRSATKRPSVIVAENAPKANAATASGLPSCSLTCRALQSLATPSLSISMNASPPSSSTRREYPPRGPDPCRCSTRGTRTRCGAATTTTSMPTRPAPPRATAGASPAARVPAPTSDPATPPTENSPWNAAMIGRR